MTRHVAFLRGVMPGRPPMPELKRCFERAGFGQVVTVLSSGNVVFDVPGRAQVATLERRLEDAMLQDLGRVYFTIVRSTAALQALLVSDPFAEHTQTRSLPGPGAKRVVSFLREDLRPRVALPLAADGACVLALQGRELFTVYVPSPKGPVFMGLIERAVGPEVTTRTWETVKKCAAT